MQIFANGKQHFYSFMEFYVIHRKNQGGGGFDHSATLKTVSTLEQYKTTK